MVRILCILFLTFQASLLSAAPNGTLRGIDGDTVVLPGVVSRKKQIIPNLKL